MNSQSAFLLVAMTASVVTAVDRSAMSPSQLIVGEWKNATETYAPDPKYPNSREYFSPVGPTKKTGTRSLRLEDGKKESTPSSIIREDNEKRILEIFIHLRKFIMISVVSRKIMFSEHLKS